MHEHTHPWIPYCGIAPEPRNLLASWNFDVILLALIGGALVCAWRRAPQLKTSHIGAALAILVLFVSPLCALGSALFAMRAVHHVALALVLAPLLVDSLALEKRVGPTFLGLLTAAQAIIFWFWHVPEVYAAALSNHAVFWIMQVSITASTALWWASMRQSNAPSAVAATLATMVQMGALGALLTFAGRAFYAPHFQTTLAWGWTPLEDQQVAGLIMWAPASGAYLLIALAILYRSMQPAPAQ